MYWLHATNCSIIDFSISQNKRDFIIDQQRAKHFCNTVNVVQTPLPFYATQIINNFFNSRISVNHWDFSQSWNSYAP